MKQLAEKHTVVPIYFQFFWTLLVFPLYPSNRIKKTNSIFVQIYPIWKIEYISRNTKLKSFKNNLKAVLLYGSETSLSNYTVKSELKIFTNRYLQRILNIHWPVIISNKSLWRPAEDEAIAIQIRRHKWR